MRYRKRNKKILVFLILILCLMTAAYAAFRTELNITGTSNISNNWDIEITGVTVGTITGNAENVSSPTYNALTASMEANVYEEGDSVSYDVTISNLGTVDAKLGDITKNITTNNEAIKITYSGYTKGERLYKHGENGSTKTITVTISYNEEYEGTLDYNTSTQTSVTFDYVQATGSSTTPDNPVPNQYLVRYNCENNSCSNYNEYFDIGERINLNKEAPQKSEYVFLGWNTNSNANSNLETLTMTEQLVQELGMVIDLYAIYEEDVVNLSLSTTSTSNQITITANATATSGIASYAYTLNGSSATCKSGTANNICIVEGLTQDTSYSVGVTVTANSTKTATTSTTKSTKEIDAPSYDLNKNVVTITFPGVQLEDGSYATCSNKLACVYSKDNGQAVRVTSQTSGASVNNDNSTSINVTFITSGTIISSISDYRLDNNGNEVIVNIVNGSTFNFAPSATGIYYDNTKSGLNCNNAQCAVDKIKEMLE